MKYWFAAILAFFVMAGAGCAVFSRPSTDTPAPQVATTEPVSDLVGVVGFIDPVARQFSLVLPDGSKEELSYGEGLNLAGLKLGMLVHVDGTRDRSTRVIRVSSAVSDQGTGIYVTSPTVGATVTSPLVAFGFAEAPLGQVEWRLRDTTGLSRAEGIVPVMAVAPGGFGPFRLDAFIPAFSHTTFSLEITVRKKDGTEQATVSVPLTLLSTDVVTFNVYYPNNREGSARDCSLVFPVPRTMNKTSATARAAMIELLKGPTATERATGAFSSFPSDVALRSLVVDGSSALVDFSRPLSYATGACQTAAIRSGIAQTLLQFFPLGSVTVTVEGREIQNLQP